MPRALITLCRIASLCAALGALASCVSTQITTSWVDPSAGTVRLNSVMTLVISKDEITKRIGEDELVKQMTATKAVPAYKILSEAELKDSERANQALRAVGIDGVISMRLVGAQSQTTFVPSMYPTFWGYYRWASPMAYSPGYLVTDQIVRVETKVYSLKEDKLVWAGVSDTFNPASARDLLDDVARAVTSDLKKLGMVQ